MNIAFLFMASSVVIAAPPSVQSIASFAFGFVSLRHYMGARSRR